jgi:outer membrane protein OmpA-like peptidoglycan-associated protein
MPGRDLHPRGAKTASPPSRDPVAKTLSPGQPLDRFLRAPLESGMGHDFASVRIHADAPAALIARNLSARAFTTGTHIVFGQGEFSPHTSRGKRLLAHELAHVAQPRRGGTPSISRPGDASEREADRVADSALRGERAVPVETGAAVQRVPAPGSGADTILENASPFLAASVGSANLDGFDTGKSDLKAKHKKEIAKTAHNIQVLLRKYPRSTLSITGHTDTVGSDADNMKLGQERADAVRAEMVVQGVPEQIISAADSVGEGAPQAVKTKDETPNAKNRRVEVHFHPEAGMAGPDLPTLKGADKPPDKPKDDPMATPIEDFGKPRKRPGPLDPTPKDDPNDRTRLPPDFWKPIPPIPRGMGPKSVLDFLGEKVVDPFVDKTLGWAPKSVRDKVKEGLRDGIKTGSAKAARAAAEAAGVKDPQALDAIEKTTEAAIQAKEKAP